MNTFMQRAIELAQQTDPKPNPKVGCVIVKENKIIGEGYHEKAGFDHAEIVALKQCDARDATLYTTLEPCTHFGKTPPCVDAIIKAGVRKVVVGSIDPNLEKSGITTLQEAGIEVQLDLQDEAEEMNKHFFKHSKTKLPYIYLKAAITLDGKIATKDNDSKWISCKQSRIKVHELRSQVDAILVGKNTVIQDNPQLNARLETITYPIRVVLDTHNELDKSYNVFAQEGETIVFTKENCQMKNNKLDLHDVLRQLGEQNIQSVLVEGGCEIFTSFIDQQLVDEFWFFITPKILGEGISFYQNNSNTTIKDALQLEFRNIEKVGTDIWVRSRCKR